MTGRIALEGLEFRAFHGVYAYERETGNQFVVDIAVETDFSQGALHDELSGTVDYELLYRIVKEEMEKPSHLIETVAEKIVDNVLNQLAAVIVVELKVSKLAPPIGGPCKCSSITITKKR